jgi:uncharacterized protein (TIGR00730 family)
MPKIKTNTIAAKMPKSLEEQSLGELDLQSSDSITWRIFRIMSEFVSGFQFLAQFKKTVSFFGSARTSQESRYYEEAVLLAKSLGRLGFNVVTGGGSGIMEAGNRGAHEAGVHSIGLNIQLPYEQRINRYVSRAMGFHYFFTRKVMLSAAGQAYVFFPGGFGTLDEFFEITTLIQTGKMEPIPIILYGDEFWSPMVRYIKDVVHKKFKTIDAKDVELFIIVDSVNEAIKLVKKSKPRKDF